MVTGILNPASETLFRSLVFQQPLPKRFSSRLYPGRDRKKRFEGHWYFTNDFRNMFPSV